MMVPTPKIVDVGIKETNCGTNLDNIKVNIKYINKNSFIFIGN